MLSIYQELVWCRWEQLYYLFYTYKGAISMGPSEFYTFVKEARLTSSWLSAAKIHALFVRVSS